MMKTTCALLSLVCAVLFKISILLITNCFLEIYEVRSSFIIIIFNYIITDSYVYYQSDFLDIREDGVLKLVEVEYGSTNLTLTKQGHFGHILVFDGTGDFMLRNISVLEGDGKFVFSSLFLWLSYFVNKKIYYLALNLLKLQWYLKKNKTNNYFQCI